MVDISLLACILSLYTECIQDRKRGNSIFESTKYGKIHSKKLTLTNTAYNKIKRMIIKHEFVPGEVLSKNVLANLFQMSRTPIREALKMLQRDDLVVSVQGSGTFVKEISENELRDLFSVRIVLECLGIETSVNFMDPQIIDEMLIEWENFRNTHDISDQYWENLAVADNRLHNMIVYKSHNSVLCHLYEMLSSKIIRYQHLSAISLGNSLESTLQHVEILNLIKDKKIIDLKAVIAEHINMSMQNILNKL